jgi:hypothetical protein
MGVTRDFSDILGILAVALSHAVLRAMPQMEYLISCVSPAFSIAANG